MTSHLGPRIFDDVAELRRRISHLERSEAGGGPGRLLALVRYLPATDTRVLTTTSTSFVDADAANLVVSFVAPSSGRVLIYLSAIAFKWTTGAAYWNLRSGTTNVADTRGWVVPSGVGASARYVYPIPVFGLTPRTSYTYKWGVASSDSNATDIYAGAQLYGPAVMEVWEA